MNPKFEIRIEEIIFVTYVEDTLRKLNNPSKMYEFMESLSVMYFGDGLMLRRAVSEVICRRAIYHPQAYELAAIAAISSKTMEKSAKTLGVSKATLYRKLDGAKLDPPKFAPELYAEIHKFLEYLNYITDLLEFGGFKDADSAERPNVTGMFKRI